MNDWMNDQPNYEQFDEWLPKSKHKYPIIRITMPEPSEISWLVVLINHWGTTILQHSSPSTDNMPPCYGIYSNTVNQGCKIS